MEGTLGGRPRPSLRDMAIMSASSAALLLLAARPAVCLEMSQSSVTALSTQADHRLKNARFGQFNAEADLVVSDATAADADHELEFACGCGNADFQFSPTKWDVRGLSNKMAESGDKPGGVRPLSNFWWVWGQFVVHDMVSTVNMLDVHDPNDGWWEFEMTGSGKSPAPVMKLKRALVRQRGKCRTPLSVATPEHDLSNVYGNDAAYLRNTLREPGNTCRLVVGPGDFLPLSESKEGGSAKFVSGDHRGNQHAGMFILQTLFLRLHNWGCDLIESHFDGRANTRGLPYYVGFTMEDRFQRTKNATIAWAQEMTREWLTAAGLPPQFVRRGKSGMINSPAVSVEFAHSAMRVFDDMIPNSIGGEPLESLIQTEDYFGVSWQNGVGQYDVGSATKKFDGLVEKLTSTKANAMDGKISNAMRNAVHGSFGVDIASVDIWRARELGVKSYQQLAACFGTPVDEEIAKQTKDPWVAMVLENAKMSTSRNGAKQQLGPLAYAVIIEQFRRTLFDDKLAVHWRQDKDLMIKGYVKEVLGLSTGDVLRMLTGANVDDSPFVV